MDLPPAGSVDMRTYLRYLVATVVLAATAAASAATADTLRMGGTGAVNEMLRHVGNAFTAETGIKLEVIPSLGMSGGNSAVADGVIDISVSGRPLNAAETAKGLTQIAIVRSPFGLATSHPEPNGF